MLNHKHLHPAHVSNVVAIKDITLPVEIPHLNTREITIALHIDNAITSVGIDQANLSYQPDRLEIYNLPPFGFDVGHDSEGNHFAGKALKDSHITIMPRTKKGTPILKQDSIACYGAFDFAFGKGSDLAPFQLHIGDGKLDHDVAEAFGTFQRGKYVVQHTATIKGMTVAEMQAMQKEDYNPKDHGGIERVFPDLSPDMGPEDMCQVAFQDDSLNDKLFYFMVLTCKELFKEGAERIRDFYLRFPETLPNMAMENICLGHGADVLKVNMARMEQYVKEMNYEFLPDAMREALVHAYDEEEPTKAIKHLLRSIAEPFEVPALVNHLDGNVGLLMALLDEATARHARNPEYMLRYAKQFNQLRDELEAKLEGPIRDLYFTEVKPALEREVEKLAMARFFSPEKLFQEMTGGLDLSAVDPNRFEEAELTNRQMSELLEEHPEAAEVINQILDSMGKTLDDMEGGVIRPKNDNQ